MLPVDDRAYLAEGFPRFIESVEGGMFCVVLPDFPLPERLTPIRADLLLRLAPGYPDVPPDMWWFKPGIHRSDGQPIPGTEATEKHLGNHWQRWSRHLQPHEWRPGVDSLRTFLAFVKTNVMSAAS